MSTIVLANIFLKTPYDENDKVVIDDVLTKLSDEVIGSRKGRYWEVVKNGKRFVVDIRNTESKLFQCEDELLELNLLPEDAPEFISVISNNVKEHRESNFKFISNLTDVIVTTMQGITNGPKYIS